MVLPDGFVLVPDTFDLASAAAHLERLLAEVGWEEERFTIYGRTMPMPRLIAMYGPVGYRYSGVVHPPRPLPPRLEAIRRRVEEVTGRPFNSVLANLYRDGRDSVGWHRDSDYAHGGHPDIASVSFGATRRFDLRDRSGKTRAAVDLASGSLLLMTGDAVARWWHRVPKTARAVGPRVNLTFRYMVGQRDFSHEEQVGREVNLERTLHDAWIALLKLGQDPVVERFLRVRCRSDPRVDAVEFSRICRREDRAPAPHMRVRLDCRSGDLDTHEEVQ